MTINEDVGIALDAADEEITVAQTAVAGTADTPLISIDDDRTGATANTAGEATLKIDAEGTHAIAVLDGIVAVESILDTYAAGALLLGSAEATSVEIGDALVATDVQGKLTVLGTTGRGIDTAGATALYVGEEAAASLLLGATDCPTTVSGTLKTTAILTSTEAGATGTLDADDYGTIVMCTQAGAVTLTLPANGIAAGTWIDVMQGNPADNTTAITVEAATADTLIGPNDVDLDSITFPAGSRIGGYARFISNGSFWQVQNLGGTTMTYTD